MWVLVFIDIVIGTTRFDVETESLGVYQTISQCFHTRDAFILQQGRVNGFPKPNTQFVCVRLDSE